MPLCKVAVANVTWILKAEEYCLSNELIQQEWAEISYLSVGFYKSREMRLVVVRGNGFKVLSF